jgi:nucleotide-binding universal stress UspA family protein
VTAGGTLDMKRQTKSKRGAPSRAVSGTGARSGDSEKLNLSKVVIATDFSPLSKTAVAAAAAWVKRIGAELHLIYVLPTEAPIAGIAGVSLIMPEQEVARNARARLRRYAHSLSFEATKENIHTPQGYPYEEICRLARTDKMDLIVIATHGWTGFKYLLLGSNAERVVRFAPCPVLVMRSHQGDQQAKSAKIRKIIVGVDFSELSREGLTYAAALARRFDADLVLLHSVDLRYYSTSPESMVHDFPELLEVAQHIARDQMAELVRQTDRQGRPVKSILEFGHAGDRIVNCATESGADLIVISTHGRTGLKRALLGSTAEYVVRHASCPVLVVPSRPHRSSDEKEC